MLVCLFSEGMRKTRSQTRSETGGPQKVNLMRAEPLVWMHDLPRIALQFEKDDLVFAHKAKVVPFWFPGVVTGKAKRGGQLKINFLADFGFADCPLDNIMLYSDYEKNKEQAQNKNLFKVPKKYEPNYNSAVAIAEAMQNSK